MERYIFWLDEARQQDIALLGKKSANLGEMTKLGVRVPKGFALSLKAYEDFLAETSVGVQIQKAVQSLEEGTENINRFIEVSNEVRELIELCEMPGGIRETILSHYRGLCQKCYVDEMPVSVRSSGPVSRPGQYETYLNVVGESDLLEKVKKVWASSFNPRSLAFRVSNRLPLESDPIGVAVIRMVDARAAGVLFTADPNTADTSTMIIEGNWGLGESVVSGEVTPDIYVLAKDRMAVSKRVLGQKAKYVSLKQVGVAEEDAPDHKKCAFCLSDDEAKGLAEIGQILERHFGVPQDVEWAIEENTPLPQSIIILQSRAAVMATKKSAVDQAVDLMVKWL